MRALSADCYYGDHEWRGGSQCVRWGCTARLRCLCGRFVREDDIDQHMDSCSVVERWSGEDV